MTGLISSRSSRLARRRAIVYAVLVSVSIGFMAISGSSSVRELQSGVGFAFRPLQVTASSVAASIGSVVATVQEIDSLRQDNAALRAANDRLTADNGRLREIQHENDLLTALLAVKNGTTFHTIAATVIGRERPEIGRIVTIDRGTNDGLAVGDVVVAAGGALAGRVTDAASTTAHVTLINDPTSTVTGMVESNRVTGDVTGQLGGVLVMRNIEATARVNIGDQVVTAGIDLGGGIRSPYPKGLLIGQVVDVQRDANAIVQTAFLQPTADLDKVEYLLVITDYQGGLPLPSAPGSPLPVP
ncbi:MAG: rod shape-determining protein MreC [Candidatus Limnocylindrales bacterium]